MSDSAMVDAVCEELETHGVAVNCIVNGGKHKRIYFDCQGREQFYVASLSPSDRRAHLNAQRDIRHMLGVKRKIHKNPNRRPKVKAKRPVKAPDLSGFGVNENPFDRLKDIEFRKPTFWDRVKGMFK